MSCPQCNGSEISSSGKCLSCGYQLEGSVSEPASEPEATDHANSPGMIRVEYSGGTPANLPQEEVPPWRKELAQRLQAIKQKREAAGASEPGTQPENKIPSAPPAAFAAAAQPEPPRAKPIQSVPARKPVPKPLAPIPRQKTLQPLALETPAAKPAEMTADPAEIRQLIDTVVSRQAQTAEQSPLPAGGIETMPPPFADSEGKLILLSRTLSGLVDLICVVLCTGIFILSADFFSGIIVLDLISLADFSALLLATYFVYSLFFLAASNQTIGMMITDLRVIAVGEGRPSLKQLVIRCCAHLGSLLVLGIGLLWSLFNRENLCLHDRLSGTMIIRI